MLHYIKLRIKVNAKDLGQLTQAHADRKKHVLVNEADPELS